MSMEFLIACAETPFRFDNAALRASAAGRWPAVEYVAAHPSEGRIAEGELVVPGDDGVTASQVALFPDGEGIGLDSRDVEAAADVLAWLATFPGLPGDGTVVVVEWQNDVYPLRPGVSAAELVADYQL